MVPGIVLEHEARHLPHLRLLCPQLIENVDEIVVVVGDHVELDELQLNLPMLRIARGVAGSEEAQELCQALG